MGEAGVEEEGVGFHQQAGGVHSGLAAGDHLDADAGERAALGEVQRGEACLQEIELRRVARPEGEGEREGAVILLLDGENLSVLTRPKGIG